MKLSGIYFILMWVCISNSLFSQMEYNNWYFGEGAAITFNYGPPVSLTGCKLNTHEGCASIADKNGNLLFYMQGDIIYNKDHIIMLNGSELTGHYSSTQIQIIPHPGNEAIYYVFTVDAAENHLINGLRYSVVDLSMDNGRGAVISKNNLLLSNSTEKIVVGRHLNGTDFWLIAHAWGNNNFNSYLINSAGLNVNPVISPIGMIHIGGGISGPAKDYVNASGYLKLSKNCTKLAVAVHYERTIQLFNFNNSSGIVTELIGTEVLPGDVYGIEFSENEEFLYISTLYGNSSLYQFSILNNSLYGRVLIANPGNDRINSLQIGPDGRIYVAQYGSHYLGVIQNPNNAGNSCNYVQNEVSLGQGTSYRGLPLYLAPLPLYSNFMLNEDCFGASQSFSIISSHQPDSVSWDFGDPTSGPDNTSTDTFGVHHYTSPGNYDVELTFYALGTSGKIKKSIRLLTLPRVGLGNDTVLCDGEHLLLDVSSYQGTFRWSDGSTDPLKTITNPGNYSVEVSNSCGTGRDTIKISYSVISDLLYSGDTTICMGEELVIQALEKPGIVYNWSTGEQTSFISIKPLSNTRIGLQVVNEYGCMADYYKNIKTINCYYQIEIPNVFTPNQDNINDFWIIKNIEHYPKAEINIYTRWGNQIYKSKGYETPWDGIYNGKILPLGCYYYVIILNNGTPAYIGHVSIYR